MSEREIEEILQTEQDEAKVELAIDEYLRSRGINPGVPGGRYWEPGWEDSDIDTSRNNYSDEELPF